MANQADTIDLADVARSLRRGWRTVVGYTVFGLVAAGGVLVFAPKRYASTATVVLRSAEPLSAGLARLAGAGGGAGGAGMLGSDAAEALTGARTPIETELQILQSASVADSVMDSLHLQARVKTPSGVAPWRLLSELRLPASFRKVKLSLTRIDSVHYRVQGAGIDTVARAGEPLALLGGVLTLRDTALPPTIVLQLLDREDALERFQKRLSVSKAGGEVAKVSFVADDSLTAPQVANQVLSAYLSRRKTTDRGVNQHRAEFLEQQLDSTERMLSAAERALRRFQESSGILNAEVYGKVELEQGAALRRELTSVQVEEGAINQLLDQVAKGTMNRRHLAAFPAFVKGSALPEIMTELSLLESERLKLLERRTERDPEVLALTQSIAAAESQFIPMAQSYSSSMRRRRIDLTAQLDTLKMMLGVLPGAAESGNRLTRNVFRLGQIFAALQGQLVEARLAAIGEGGQVRQLDIAKAPKKPSFPRPLPTLSAGGLGGLVLGVIAAMALSAFGRWARDPLEIERATGVPTLRFDRHTPLMVANGASRAVLVVPLHPQADALRVATQVVETALSRATSATLLDLADGVPVRGAAMDVNGTINRLATEFETVVVRLPALTSGATMAALNPDRPVIFVVPTGRVSREELMSAMQTLRRLEIPCAGIVVSGGTIRSELARGTSATAT